TRALGAGSAAIDVVPAAGCAANDQRGITRPQGAACDAGAYEVAPPAVTTGSASGIAQTAATVAGTVDPHLRATTFHFELGTTAGLGQQTAEEWFGSGPAGSVSAALSGLTADTTFFFRLVATNPDGTTTGSTQSFKTTANPPPPPPPFAGLTIPTQK